VCRSLRSTCSPFSFLNRDLLLRSWTVFLVMADRQSTSSSESGAQQSIEDAAITLSSSRSAVDRLVLGFGKQDEVSVFCDGFWSEWRGADLIYIVDFFLVLVID